MKKFFTLLLAVLLATAVIQASPSSISEPSSIPAKIPAGYTELNYSPAGWNEAPDMKFYNSSSNIYVQNSDIKVWTNSSNDPQSLIVEFTTTESAVFFFQSSTSNAFTPIRMYCDGELISTLTPLNSSKKYSINLSVGEHQIKFEVDAKTGSFYFNGFGVVKTPRISVELIEPGSLGTEILYNDVDRLQDVRNLKIKGTLNNDDVDKLSMMKDNLVSLDLSEANLPTIRQRLFYDASFLTTIILPQNLKSIEEYAFYSCPIEHIEFPESLESIGKSAFSESSLIEAIMPDATVNLGIDAFYSCYRLKTVRLSDNLVEIPASCFCHCNLLELCELPSSLKIINSYAFEGCYHINMELPPSLQSIGSYAFEYTNSTGTIKETLTIPEGCTLGYRCFSGTNYKYVILPTSFSSVETTFPNTVERIKLKSATVVSSAGKDIVDNNSRSNITLEVPSYLVNSYKLDSYWYNFKEIVGFDTDEIDFWNVKADLVLNARDRMLGTPSIDITNTGSIKINGTDPMPINNLQLYVINGRYPQNSRYGRIYSNADGVTVDGNLCIYMRLDTEKTWYYISLPFDIKVSDIQHLTNGFIAIRYYDGAKRALNGASGNWTDYDADAIIPAGTGFIANVSIAGTLRFTSLDNDSKQFVTSNRMFVTPLEANASDVASNRGWNLIGNPYQCYYNIHKLNFTAPITVRDVYQNKYEAYSIIDDDYALQPNQAFFVQCPDGVGAITFPLDGRQMSSEILSQQGAPAKNPQACDRRLADITVRYGEINDRTRVVLNESASTDYEISCDAGKFLTDNESPVLLYSIEDGECYAINERPALDGKVKLGFYAAQAGQYTIELTRNDNEHIYLTDMMTGVVTDITLTPYSFESEAGTFDNRFMICIENSTSLIQNVGSNNISVTTTAGKIAVDGSGIVEVYTPAGVKIAAVNTSGAATINVAPGIYLVKTANGVVKVSVN